MLCNCNDLVILKYQVESRYIISAGPGVDLFTWEGIYTYPNYPYMYHTHTHTHHSLSLPLSPSCVQASTDPNPSIYISIGTLVHIFLELMYSADSKYFWSQVDLILSLGIGNIQLNTEPTP